MEIHENDFVLTLASEDGDLFDLRFYKRVKKRDTGKFEMELGSPLYGLSLSSALKRIATHRTAKKYEEENISLKEFLTTFQANYVELVKLCRETLPEKFDTGE